MYILDSPSTPEVAIDLGTANTRVTSTRSGLVESESSVAGNLPLRHGVVVDIHGASQLLAPLIGKASGRRRANPRALVCIPTDANADEREALIAATMEAGARAVAIVPEPLAVAIGAGVDIGSCYANMLVDIGDGVTDIAVFRDGDVIRTSSLRVACSDLRLLVGDWLTWHRRVTMPQAKLDAIVRTACRPDIADSFEFRIAGVTGRPVTAADVRTLIDTTLDDIASFVTSFFVRLPDSEATEIIENGIVVTGGGASLPRCVARLTHHLRLAPEIPADPMHAVIAGARTLLTGPKAGELWG